MAVVVAEVSMQKEKEVKLRLESEKEDGSCGKKKQTYTS